MVFVMVEIDAGCDPADKFSPAARQKQAGFGGAVKGVLFAVEKSFTLGNQMRHPVGIVLIERKRQFDKLIEIGGILDLAEFDIAFGGYYIHGLNNIVFFAEAAKNFKDPVQLLCGMGGGIAGSDQRHPRSHRRGNNGIGENTGLA
jgi:hypothetical protein